jgi:hypothetical protein
MASTRRPPERFNPPKPHPADFSDTETTLSGHGKLAYLLYFIKPYQHDGDSENQAVLAFVHERKSSPD